MFLFLVLVVSALSLAILGGVIQGWLATMIGWSGALLIFFATLRWHIIAAFLLLGFALLLLGTRCRPEISTRLTRQLHRDYFNRPRFSWFSILHRTLRKLRFTTYGSLGAVIILMLWLNLAGIVLLIGGEINSLIDQHSHSNNRKEQKDSSY